MTSNRFWMAFISLLMLLTIFGFARLGRYITNSALFKNGLSAEAEIIDCHHEGDRFKTTNVKFRFLPEKGSQPVVVTKRLETIVDIQPGTKIPVRYMRGYPSICILVPYAKLHD